MNFCITPIVRYRGIALIGGCRERVTSCSGFLGADATERGGQGGGSPPCEVP